MPFKPNALTFDEGVQRLQAAAKTAGVREGAILTSRDPAVQSAVKALAITNIPEGFNKWQLPVYLDRPSQIFFSYAAPNVTVPSHSHDEGDGIRVILHGSIIYDGKELVAGDWMYIPKGAKYAFTVGPQGVGQCYCYACCCA